MTRSNVRLESKNVADIRDYKTLGLRIPLFIKKSDGEGTDFYYMGDVEPVEMAQQKDSGGRDIVNIIFELQQAVKESLYHYLVQ